jgi:predicted phosphodiesterase
MKIAVLSDIHSNIYALEEVIKDTKNRGVDVTLNLGDMFYGPIEPRKTYELIRQSQFINICGNQDRQILEASLTQLEENPTLRYSYEDLGEDVLYWIQDLPFEKLIGGTYYMIHGTYFDDTQYLLEDVSSGEPILRDEKKIIELLDDIKAPFIFCGHSHIPRCVKLSTGQVAINPGSVGLPAYQDELPNPHIMENNSPDASYIILTVDETSYNIEQIKVAYDFESAAKKAQENGREDWAYALKTGKVFKNQ